MKKSFYIGKVPIGDGRITVQSMTNTKTKDKEATLSQVMRLANAGADLVRVSVPDMESAKALDYICKNSPVPIIADIHFSAECAIASIENGASKIRINPANLSEKDISLVAKKCSRYDIPVRVGANKGGFYKEKITPEILVEKTLESARIIEDAGWSKIVLATKSSSVPDTVTAYRILHAKTDYPLHIGLTEAGASLLAVTKSSIAIGSLILDGIGDTVRVSLSGDPVQEVLYAKNILRSCGMEKNFCEVISCPTCARTEIEIERIAKKIEEMTADIRKPIKIAVMGCVVNGIGESKDADFGVCGGNEQSSIFEKGKIIKTVPNDNIIEEIMKLVEKYK